MRVALKDIKGVNTVNVSLERGEAVATFAPGNTVRYEQLLRAIETNRITPVGSNNERQVEEKWLEGKRTVGITSGASAPEELVQHLVDFFRGRGTTDIGEYDVIHEDVRFMLPKTIRKALAEQPS